MRTKVELDEDLICREYTESKIGVESLALKYHVGKLKIKAILEKRGIATKKRGAQSNNKKFVVEDFRTPKYVDGDDYHYEVVDKKNPSFTSKDLLNRGGVLTTYINTQYNVEIPTLYDRRMYYMETGNYWWEQWLTYVRIDNKPFKKCPFCEWTTTDINNTSGAFEMHLRNAHGVQKTDYIKLYPNEREYFKLASHINDLQMEDDTDKFVVCKVCGKKVSKIGNRHLKSHGITKEQYIMEYGPEDIMCKETYDKFCTMIKKTNMEMLDKGGDKFTSSAEKEIMEYINKRGVECMKDRRLLEGKELDIYVPSRNIAIEYNGLFWHTEKYGKDKNYHYDKMVECNKKGVGLIEIFDDEYMDNYELVMNKIAHILHIEDEKPKVYARKCTVREIYSYQAEKFLNKYHIQGSVKATVYLGCFHDNDMVAVMAFKNGSIKNEGWELSRFATDYHYHIVGVGGKMFKYFVNKYDPDTVISFADRRWTIKGDDNLYTKLDFKLVDTLRPDYKYYNEKIHGNKRVHKMSLSKKAMIKKYNMDERLTEWEMARLLGYDRIWDCGMFKYMWKRPTTA